MACPTARVYSIAPCCSETKKHGIWHAGDLQHLQLFNEDFIKILVFISLTRAMLVKLAFYFIATAEHVEFQNVNRSPANAQLSQNKEWATK